MEVIEADFQEFEQLLKLVGISGLGRPHCCCYNGEDKDEMALKPSKIHLSKLIDRMATENFDGVLVENSNGSKRKKLIYGDDNERKAAGQEAQRELDKHYDSLIASYKPWYIFEGFTYPDIFIEGDDYVIVCEGKWTESDITRSTTHLKFRDQIVRHIQGALNYTNKKVYGFYIVDENCNYCNELKKDAFAGQLEKETIELDNAEKEQILEAYHGFTTWQDIQKVIPSVRFKTKEEIQQNLKNA